jgi:hypothetical protein
LGPAMGAILVIVSFMLAGCGTGSPSERAGATASAPQPPMTMSAFAAAMDGICDAATQRLAQALRYNDSERLVQEAAVLRGEALEQMSALLPPPRLRRAFERLKSTLLRRNRISVTLLAKLERRDIHYERVENALNHQVGIARALARHLGLHSCPTY